MDIQRIFEDDEYKKLIEEYHGFVWYIIRDINAYSIYSSSVQFTKNSVIYKHIDEFMRMLRDTFPVFVVTFETSEQLDELEKDEMSVTVDWSEYKESFVKSK